MNAPREEQHARTLLRLLLNGAPPPPWEEADWRSVAEIARKQGILVRTAQRLGAMGVALPEHFAAAVAAERTRVGTMLDVVERLGPACTRDGVDFVFPSALQHHPDIGDDVDLLVPSGSRARVARLLENLGSRPIWPDVRNRVAGAVRYRLEGCEALVDVHYGRLGSLGEHAAYALILMRNRIRMSGGGITAFVPSPEDQMVLQGLRVYGRRSLSLADIAWTIAATRANALDWGYVLRTAVEQGVFPGLCCHLACVERLHADVLGSSLLPPELRPVLAPAGRQWLEFRGGSYRLSVLAVNTRLYRERLVRELLARDWAAATRLCLLPPLVALLRLARPARAPLRPSAGRELP